MSFFGDLVGGFTGKSQQGDINDANAKATAALGQGRTEATANYRTAQGMFNPYAQQGQRANQLYGDATGANGQDAYKTAMTNYAGSDPFRDQNAAYANNQLMRQYNARGMGNSGNANLAVARAQTERGAQDFNSYLGRLQGQGQQGYQATSAQAGLEQGIGDINSGYGQQTAGNAINYGNAMAGTRNILGNNLMGLGGLALKAFAPSPGGGVNQLFGGGKSPGYITQNPAGAGDLPWLR